MSDLIDRQDAKDVVDMELDAIDHVPEWVYDRLLTALDKVPSAQAELAQNLHTTCTDAISRQAAIEAIHEDADWLAAQGSDWQVERMERDKSILKSLPSAQPEIIRCKDCKWWDKSEDSPFGYCMAMKHGYMSTNWEIGIYRRYKGDFYCADAERRTDE